MAKSDLTIKTKFRDPAPGDSAERRRPPSVLDKPDAPGVDDFAKKPADRRKQV